MFTNETPNKTSLLEAVRPTRLAAGDPFTRVKAIVLLSKDCWGCEDAVLRGGVDCGGKGPPWLCVMIFAWYLPTPHGLIHMGLGYGRMPGGGEGGEHI